MTGEEMREQEEILEAMKIIKQQLIAAFDAIGDGEVSKKIAKGLRNLYVSLVAEGFSPDQAMQLIIQINNNK